MRFDYQPPLIKRLLTLYLVIIGLGCVSIALFYQNKHEAQKQETISIKKPIVISNSHVGLTKPSPVLSLDNNIPAIEKKLAQTGQKNIAVAVATTWHTITVQVGDTMSKLFDKIGISNNVLNKIMSNSKNRSVLSNLRPGQKLDFLLDESKELQQIKLNLSSTKALHVTKIGHDFKYHYEEKEPTKKINFSAAKINGSLYAAAQSVGLDDRLIMQMADIFSCEIDFSLDIRDNDSFKVLYEEEYILDQKIKTGKILAVEFKNQGKIYRAVRYTDNKGHSGYYTPDGYSLQKTFLRSPVEFTRISSHFSNARRHPILHKLRSHKGVDYAAPTGTPIKSAADGKISFIGVKGGYGNSVEITHGHKYSTFYAHLSRFGKKLKHGSTVKQGQIIGYVGKTGLATGAHLHYEFRINGVHHNPVTVPLPRLAAIPNKFKSDFTIHASNMLAMLESKSRLAQNE